MRKFCLILILFLVLGLFTVNAEIYGIYLPDINPQGNEAPYLKTDSLSGSPGIGSPDDECKNMGFDFGVAKWQCEDSCFISDRWFLDQEIFPGTSVSGSCWRAF